MGKLNHVATQAKEVGAFVSDRHPFAPAGKFITGKGSSGETLRRGERWANGAIAAIPFFFGKIAGGVGRVAGRVVRFFRRSRATEEVASAAIRTFFHKGVLIGGKVCVSAKGFCTTASLAEASALPLEGAIHEFRIPETVLIEWQKNLRVTEATTQMGGRTIKEWVFIPQAQRVLEQYRVGR